ncbi:MAG: ornithine cyclodeaminase family protein [Thermoplasmata archaeon]
MRILRRDDVKELLTPEAALRLMREAFQALAKGDTSMPPRTYIGVERHRGELGFMPAYVESMDSLGMKAVALYLDNPPKFQLPTIVGSMLLLDPESGRTLALMDAGPITAVRTAAVSALATDFLARKDSAVAGFLGAGVQARSHAIALKEVRPIRRILAYSRTLSKTEKFARWAARELDLEADAVPTAKEVVAQSDIVTTATPATSPILEGLWIQDGTHLNVIGSGLALEVDGATYARTAKVVVDHLDYCLGEARDIIAYSKDGTIAPEEIYSELGDLALGLRRGRENPEEITLFRSIGLAIEDVASAKHVYDLAILEDRGLEVEFP